MSEESIPEVLVWDGYDQDSIEKTYTRAELKELVGGLTK